VPRGAAMAWFVFEGQPLLFASYLLALALDYIYCVASAVVYRRVREIPRRQLVWDVGCIILGAPICLRPRHAAASSDVLARRCAILGCAALCRPRACVTVTPLPAPRRAVAQASPVCCMWAHALRPRTLQRAMRARARAVTPAVVA